VALLTLGWPKCSICDETLLEGDDIVATTHFIGENQIRFGDSRIPGCIAAATRRGSIETSLPDATANASAACIRAATTKRGRTD
jgi:hypothetical protein